MEIERIDVIPLPPPEVNEIEKPPETIENENPPVEESTEPERVVDLFA